MRRLRCRKPWPSKFGGWQSLFVWPSLFSSLALLGRSRNSEIELDLRQSTTGPRRRSVPSSSQLSRCFFLLQETSGRRCRLLLRAGEGRSRQLRRTSSPEVCTDTKTWSQTKDTKGKGEEFSCKNLNKTPGSCIRGLTITMVINDLQVMGWSSKRGSKLPKSRPSQQVFKLLLY